MRSSNCARLAPPDGRLTTRDTFFIASTTLADDAVQDLPPERERTAALLDELQVAESAGAEALTRWAAYCPDPVLAAVLVLVALRDADHAALAAARRRELGGPSAGEVGHGLAGFCRSIASTELADRSKLSMLLARFPVEAHDTFADEIASVGDDDETRALLDVIGDDERISLSWLRAMYDAAPGIALPSVLPAARALLDLLGGLVVAEQAAAEVFDAWSRVCPAPSLRGGLRVIAAREATHAHVARARLRALGGVATVAIDETIRRDALLYFGDATIPDAAKLDALLSRYSSEDAVTADLCTAARAGDTDPITRTQLEWMAATEVATITWLRRYRDAA